MAGRSLPCSSWPVWGHDLLSWLLCNPCGLCAHDKGLCGFPELRVINHKASHQPRIKLLWWPRAGPQPTSVLWGRTEWGGRTFPCWLGSGPLPQASHTLWLLVPVLACISVSPLIREIICQITIMSFIPRASIKHLLCARNLKRHHRYKK